jgi:hypothetical protein
MNWMNLIVLIVRALLLGGATYTASKGQHELAATLGAAAGAVTVSGGYKKE